MTEMYLCKPSIGKHSTTVFFIKTVQHIAKFKQFGDKVDICILLRMAIKLLYLDLLDIKPLEIKHRRSLKVLVEMGISRSFLNDLRFLL